MASDMAREICREAERLRAADVAARDRELFENRVVVRLSSDMPPDCDSDDDEPYMLTMTLVSWVNPATGEREVYRVRNLSQPQPQPQREYEFSYALSRVADAEALEVIVRTQSHFLPVAGTVRTHLKVKYDNKSVSNVNRIRQLVNELAQAREAGDDARKEKIMTDLCKLGAFHYYYGDEDPIVCGVGTSMHHHEHIEFNKSATLADVCRYVWDHILPARIVHRTVPAEELTNEEAWDVRLKVTAA